MTALKNDRFLRALLKQPVDVTPIWMMRQAGRYLPEYRATRAKAGDFVSLMKNPELACEVTIQPLDRYPQLDAAILFSDILTIPDAMGQGLYFETGEGPRFKKVVSSLADIEALPVTDAEKDLGYVMDAVRTIRRELGGRVPLIGFSGSPWTLATYMVEGQGSKDQGAARSMAHRERNRFTALIDAIASHTTEYLIGQIDAGAEAVQLFDSWSGSLPSGEFDEWVIAPTRRIVDAIRSARPGVPIIGFPKGAGEKLPRYAEQTGVDAIGLDETLEPGAVGHTQDLGGLLDAHLVASESDDAVQERQGVAHRFVVVEDVNQGCLHVRLVRTWLTAIK